MNKEQIRALTNIIYRNLFDKDTTALLIHFQLSPLCLQDEDDNDLRDCMGIQALQAIRETEHRCWKNWQALEEQLTWTRAVEVVREIANEVAIEAKAQAAGEGIDLLTGLPIKQN